MVLRLGLLLEPQLQLEQDWLVRNAPKHNDGMSHHATFVCGVKAEVLMLPSKRFASWIVPLSPHRKLPAEQHHALSL